MCFALPPLLFLLAALLPGGPSLRAALAAPSSQNPGETGVQRTQKPRRNTRPSSPGDLDPKTPLGDLNPGDGYQALTQFLKVCPLFSGLTFSEEKVDHVLTRHVFTSGGCTHDTDCPTFDPTLTVAQWVDMLAEAWRGGHNDSTGGGGDWYEEPNTLGTSAYRVRRFSGERQDYRLITLAPEEGASQERFVTFYPRSRALYEGVAAQLTLGELREKTLTETFSVLHDFLNIQVKPSALRISMGKAKRIWKDWTYLDRDTGGAASRLTTPLSRMGDLLKTLLQQTPFPGGSVEHNWMCWASEGNPQRAQRLCRIYWDKNEDAEYLLQTLHFPNAHTHGQDQLEEFKPLARAPLPFPARSHTTFRALANFAPQEAKKLLLFALKDVFEGEPLALTLSALGATLETLEGALAQDPHDPIGEITLGEWAKSLFWAYKKKPAREVQVYDINHSLKNIYKPWGPIFKRMVAIEGKNFEFFTQGKGETHHFLLFTPELKTPHHIHKIASLPLEELHTVNRGKAAAVLKEELSPGERAGPGLGAPLGALHSFVEQTQFIYGPSSPLKDRPRPFWPMATLGAAGEWLQTLFLSGERFQFPTVLYGATCPPPTADGAHHLCRLKAEDTARGFIHVLITAQNGPITPNAVELFHSHYVLYFPPPLWAARLVPLGQWKETPLSQVTSLFTLLAKNHLMPFGLNLSYTIATKIVERYLFPPHPDSAGDSPAPAGEGAGKSLVTQEKTTATPPQGLPMPRHFTLEDVVEALVHTRTQGHPVPVGSSFGGVACLQKEGVPWAPACWVDTYKGQRFFLMTSPGTRLPLAQENVLKFYPIKETSLSKAP